MIDGKKLYVVIGGKDVIVGKIINMYENESYEDYKRKSCFNSNRRI